MPAIPAFSHENAAHSKKSAPVKKEQTDWGIAGDAKAVKRTISIKMTDNMRFSPDKIEVKQGETIKFVVSNDGRMMHEFVIGTKKELDAHALQMLKFPNMEHDDSDTEEDPARLLNQWLGELNTLKRVGGLQGLTLFFHALRSDVTYF